MLRGGMLNTVSGNTRLGAGGGERRPNSVGGRFERRPWFSWSGTTFFKISGVFHWFHQCNSVAFMEPQKLH